MNRGLIVVQLVIRVLELVRVWEPLRPRVPLIRGSKVLIVPSIWGSGYAKVWILRSGCLKIEILRWCGLGVPLIMVSAIFWKWTRRNIVLARLMVMVMRKLIGRGRRVGVVMGLWVEMLRLSLMLMLLLPLLLTLKKRGIRGWLVLVLLGRESLILVWKCRGG